MTAIELKNKVIGKINRTNDIDILAEVYRLLKISDDDKSSVYKLSPGHKQAIAESRNQIKRGEFLSNEEVNKKIDQWLKK